MTKIEVTQGACEKLFPQALLEKQLKARISDLLRMAEIGSVRSRAKQRASANALGEFLAWIRETGK